MAALSLGQRGGGLAASLRQRPLLAWTAALGLGLLAWLLLGEPMLATLDRLDQEAAAFRQALPSRAAALAREETRLKAAQAQAAQAQAAHLAPPDPQRLLAEVDGLAREQGLGLTSVTPLPPAGQTGPYPLQACSLLAQGDIKAVEGFLAALAQAPSLLHPLSFSLARAPGSSLLNLEIQVAQPTREAR